LTKGDARPLWKPHLKVPRCEQRGQLKICNHAEDNIRRSLAQSSVGGAAGLPSFQPILSGADLLVFFFSRH
jgi:hypothetical protein